ncbi:MAG: hypothetical protein Q3971_03085 [Moraxella sp.]|nr:hypothetical protein [Moraxella sp.]
MSNLIRCEDCRKKVSINAVNCPNCGSPLQQQKSVQQHIAKIQTKERVQARQKEQNAKVFSLLCGCASFYFAYHFLSVSFLSAFILFVSGLLALWFVKDFIQKKKPNLKRGFLHGINVVVAVVGFVVGSTAMDRQWQKELAENPELRERVAKQQAERLAREAQEKAEQAERERERERESNTSKSMLLMRCEEVIKPTLKNPRSMNVDVVNSEYGRINGKLAVIMHYYAENGFGATMLSRATCTFNDDGVLQKVQSME